MLQRVSKIIWKKWYPEEIKINNDNMCDRNIKVNKKKYDEKKKIINVENNNFISKIDQNVYQTEYDNGYKEGFCKGKEEGLVSGLNKALLEFNEKHNCILIKIDNFLLNFEQSLAMLDDVISSKLVHLALNIAKKVIESTSIKDDKNLLKKIKTILKNEKISFNKPHLLIHPDDKKIVESNFGTIFVKYGWKIFYDDKVSRGGCIVSSGDTVLDSTIFSRWTELCKLVLRKEE
ncbi:MAG: FliH/SctL family protein [Buchnera aphidicola (Schlechtendalia peitan)]